jgi:hypothetical protein
MITIEVFLCVLKFPLLVAVCKITGSLAFGEKGNSVSIHMDVSQPTVFIFLQIIAIFLIHLL